ncbi:hypothetical protein SAMN02745866_00652 [Alteromonadaceae bacterium Bs31]|nr:hypothetical protein SAMN02745866_00652 [Alteromonadaceae bacterium Bs31]
MALLGTNSFAGAPVHTILIRRIEPLQAAISIPNALEVILTIILPLTHKRYHLLAGHKSPLFSALCA